MAESHVLGILVLFEIADPLKFVLYSTFCRFTESYVSPLLRKIHGQIQINLPVQERRAYTQAC